MRSGKSRREKEKNSPEEFSAFGKAHTIATLQGRSELYIENFRKLQYFSCTEICIQTCAYRMRIVGENLHIRFFTPGEMMVTGCMKQIQFY